MLKLLVERRINNYMKEDLINEKDIQLNIVAKDWKDAIAKSAKRLVENNIVETKYIDAMIESVNEYGPYIVIGKGIALAHARPEDGVIKAGCSVITLNPPVKFNHEFNDPVSIVFCLAAVDNNAHLEMMATLVKLINSETVIQELTKQNDVKEFMKILTHLK